jgi:hypothetical protein
MKRQSIWNRRIPSVAGIAILILGVVITSAFVSTGVIFTGRAAPGNTPQNVVITNITDTSFTITYTTSDTVLGTAHYKTSGSNAGAVAFDIRDQKNGQPRPYNIHAIAINNLTPDTSYSFSITSGGGNFTNNGKDYSVRTGKKISYKAPKNAVVKGKIVNQDGSTPNDTLIYLKSDSSQTLSTLTSNGNYSVSTAKLRTKNLTSYITLSPSSTITINAVGPKGKASAAVLMKGSNPVPPITLANKYDFAATKDTTRIASQTAQVTGFPQPEDNKGSWGTVSITAPKEGQSLSDQRPTLKGTAPAGSEVEIILDSKEPLQANVIADRRGNWSYRPKNQIPPGNIDLIVNARDGSGITKSAAQSFTVLASGSQFTEPSVSPTKSQPTPTRSATPTKAPVPTIEDEPTPTFLTPTQTATPTKIVATPTAVTISPSPTALPTIAPTTATTMQPTSLTPIPSIAPTGDNDAILYALIGAVAITIGAVLLFLTGGISF